MSEEEIRLESIRAKYDSYDDIVEFLCTLDRDRTEGPKRQALIQEKFPEMDEADIVFLLFYPEGWML